MTKFISLFSGAMGLDLGLEQAGFSTAACVENDAKAVDTIKRNKSDLYVFDRSIVDVTGEDILQTSGIERGEVDLVVGGPPCQAFSVFGNRLGIEDARGQLIYEYIRIIEELSPKVFLMENVRGLLSMSIAPKKLNKNEKIPLDYFEKGSLLKSIFKEFNRIGYNINCFVVNSVNYGAPQIRERILIIGNRFGHNIQFSQPTHSNRVEDKLLPFKTLGDVIGSDSGFIDPCSEIMNFSERKLRYLSMVPEGGNWRSLPEDIQKESMGKSWYLKGGRSAYWRKLSFSFPSPTIVTMPNHAGTSMCHPKELRAITVGEAAAIQEFPNNWEFVGTTAEKFKQIGNAVPVRLGYEAGKVIKKLLEKIEKNDTCEKPNFSHSITHLRPHVRTRTFYRAGKSYAGDTSYYNYEDDDDTQMKLL